MAGAAGFTFAHFIHRQFFITRPGDEKGGVAGTAAEHAGVDLVTEGDFSDGRALEGNIPGRVAGRTIVLDAESDAPIVTGTAGFPLFHLLHGEIRVFGPVHEENLGVAPGAQSLAEIVEMVDVIENNGTESITLYFDDFLTPGFRPVGIDQRGQC